MVAMLVFETCLENDYSGIVLFYDGFMDLCLIVVCLLITKSS